MPHWLIMAQQYVLVAATIKLLNDEQSEIAGWERISPYRLKPGVDPSQLITVNDLDLLYFESLEKGGKAQQIIAPEPYRVSAIPQKSSLIRGKVDVKLIDFEWSAEAGHGSYPLLLSDKIDWEDSVQPGGKLQKVHDEFMLDKMLSRSNVRTTIGQKRRASGDPSIM